MKLILVLVLATALVSASSEPLPGNSFEDFMIGFLKGIGESKSINDLKRCIKSGQHALDEIIKAIKLIKTLKLDKVIQGVTLLVQAVNEILNMVKPCMNGYQQLIKLFNKLKHIDIKKIALKIIMHSSKIIGDITKAIGCFSSHNYKCAGEAIGNLLKILFLDTTFEDEEDDPAMEFVHKFLKGIKESTDTKYIDECIKEFEHIFVKIIEALQDIKSLSPLRMIKGIAHLIECITLILDSLKPCSEHYPQLVKLEEAIIHIDPKKVFEKIMANPLPILMDIIDIIKAFEDKEFGRAGKDFGEVSYILFLKE